MNIETKKQIGSIIREWTESILVALVLALLLRTFVIQAFKIPTGSMRMTLIEGDRILVNKLVYGPKVPNPFGYFRLPGYGKPQRGDVIVFQYPEDPKRAFIKRLIAVGGETVEIKDGDIYVNDKRVEYPPVRKTTYYNKGPYGRFDQKIIVPENSFYVLGDNSGSSKDSRYWGFVPEKNLIGKAVVIYWPLLRIRFIE